MTAAVPTIACLGWGSLCWRPEELRTSGGWRHDGPMLPLEFTRASDDGRGRLTLVITPGVPEVQSLWTLLDYETLDEAREALRKREGCLSKAVGLWPGQDASAPWWRGHRSLGQSQRVRPRALDGPRPEVPQ